MLAFGSAYAAYVGLYSTAIADAVVAALLAYLYHRFGRSWGKGTPRNLNL